MGRTRRTATLAAAAAAVGGRTATARRRRAERWSPSERGMCFQVATLEAIDAGRDNERVVL